MTEFSRPSLYKTAAEQSANLSEYQLTIDKLSQQIQFAVESVVHEYREELPKQENTALETLETIIQPWWLELKKSGLLNSLQEIGQTRCCKRILLLNSSTFLYPVEALRQYGQSAVKNIYRQEAENRLRGASITRLPESYINYQEFYQGRFYLGIEKDESRLTYTYGAPNGPLGFVSSLAEQSRLTPVNIDSPSSVLSSVHPQPLIDLGVAIQSFEVSDKLESFIKQ